MKTITFGVREFQSHLGEALRTVREGGEVIVTSRGKTVAVLTQAGRRRAGGSREERALARLADQGRLIPAKRCGPIGHYSLPPLSGATEQLLADRRR